MRFQYLKANVLIDKFLKILEIKERDKKELVNRAEIACLCLEVSLQ